MFLLPHAQHSETVLCATRYSVSPEGQSWSCPESFNNASAQNLSSSAARDVTWSGFGCATYRILTHTLLHLFGQDAVVVGSRKGLWLWGSLSSLVGAPWWDGAGGSGASGRGARSPSCWLCSACFRTATWKRHQGRDFPSLLYFLLFILINHKRFHAG